MSKIANMLNMLQILKDKEIHSISSLAEDLEVSELLKTPILCDFSETEENEKLNMNILDEYIKTHNYEKGILLIRRYYGITARK